MHGSEMRSSSTCIAGKKLIVLEFNELCPTLLDKWMRQGLLPNFSRLHRESDVFVTEADVTDPALLEPWIQWYSIHTGKSYDEHRVFHLTEGPRAGHDDVFRMLLRAGRRVMSFASMNVAPFATEGSVYVGDPWSEDGDAHPPELNVYNRFVSHNVREYSNDSSGMDAAAYAAFLAFMAQHGLSAGTIGKVIRQLGSEKLGDRRLSWRRVAVLDRMQFDVFRSYYRKYQPDFATFFANSVAHLQHSYWRHMDPDAFQVRPGEEDAALYGGAIQFGYEAMDRLLGNIMALAREEGATIMFMSALSQQPFLRHEALGGQHFHRLHDVEAFLDRMGISRIDVAPTMTHQYLMQCGSRQKAQQARARLEALRLDDGREIFDFPDIENDAGSLYFGCQISTVTDPDSPVSDRQSNASLRFGELFYRIEAIKSGCHHPDGCLWIQTGSHRLHSAKRSILDILPTQLDMLGVAPPPGARPGIGLHAARAG